MRLLIVLIPGLVGVGLAIMAVRFITRALQRQMNESASAAQLGDVRNRRIIALATAAGGLLFVAAVALGLLLPKNMAPIVVAGVIVIGGFIIMVIASRASKRNGAQQ